MESVHEIRRRDDRSVRVHDREQCRRRHPTVAGLHHADATEPVPFADLEHPRPIGPFPLRLSRGFTHLSRRDMARALLSGHRMIRETFVHIAGVGYRIEERIWRSGIRTWDDFSAAPRPPRIGQRLARRIEDEVERSAEALRSGRHRYFARKLPSREQWRAFDAFRRHVVYLDIEDGKVADMRINGQGCSISQSSASMMSSAVKGKSLDEARKLIRAFKSLMSIHEQRLDGDGQPVDEPIAPEPGVALGDLEALQGVVKFPVRIKCATLSWNTLAQGLDEAENGAG